MDPDKVTCTTPKYGLIMSCIHSHLFKICPEAKPDKECKEIKDFMIKCPSRQAPLKQSRRKNVDFSRDKLGDAMKEVVQNKNEISKNE